jgi:phospholipid transport system substrate-binding protein
MKSKIALLCTLLLPSSPAFAAPSASDDAAAVKARIEGSVNAVLDVLKDKELEREARKKKVLAVIDPLFDLPLMGKLVLGRANWPKFSEAQRKEFTDLFVKTIHDSYYEKIDLFTDEVVEFDAPVPAESGKYEMTSRVISKGQRYKLLYKVYRSGDSWKVYDIGIEGISLVRTYGAQYDQVLQKSPVAELLRKMREKTLDIPEELKRPAKPEGKP